MITKGSRVKLNEAGLKFFSTTLRGAPRRLPTPWEGRTGAVNNLTKRNWAQVIWQGNKCPCDGVPVKFLELIE